MPSFNLVVVGALVVGSLLGGLSLFLARGEENLGRTTFGRCLFVLTILYLGAMGLWAALVRSEGLAPLGLLSGLLVVGMLWEAPATRDA